MCVHAYESGCVLTVIGLRDKVSLEEKQIRMVVIKDINNKEPSLYFTWIFIYVKPICVLKINLT